MQHPDENTCNIRLIQIKHLEHTFETHVCSHCNMCNTRIYFCNILIYFCNVDKKYLQRTSEISEILEIYVCEILFQCKHLLAASANGGSSARGGHWCAHRQRGAVGSGAQRAGVGAAWAAVAQRTGGWRV